MESHSLICSLSLKALKESGLIFFIHKMEIIFLSQSAPQGSCEALNGRMSVNHWKYQLFLSESRALEFEKAVP